MKKMRSVSLIIIILIVCSLIMASGPITSWQIEGGKVEAVTDFIFLGSKITVECNSRQEIKSSIFKSRDITLLTKVHSQSYAFSRSHAWNESWTIKKAEH